MGRRSVLALGALAVAGACATHAPRPDLVALEAIAPTIARDMRYAGTDNFVGEAIDGYEAPVCLLTPPAARALAGVQAELAADGLGLLVLDCYRPQRAVDRFARWAEDLTDQRTKAAYYPRVDKARLFELGYIAAQSSHSRGSTVDLTLVRIDDGHRVPVDMGTPFDFFDPRSHGDAADVSPQQRSNRMQLRAVMERHGFRHYPAEWWHFTLADEPYPRCYFDVPVR